MSFFIIESYFQLFKTGFFFMKNPLSLSLSNPWCDVRFTVFHIANQFVSCKSISLYWFGVWIIISTHNNWRASLFFTSCKCYGNVMLTNKKVFTHGNFKLEYLEIENWYHWLIWMDMDMINHFMNQKFSSVQNNSWIMTSWQYVVLSNIQNNS